MSNMCYDAVLVESGNVYKSSQLLAATRLAGMT